MNDILFQSFKLNDTLTLQNRLVMAPLTRCMSDENLMPTDASVEYYGRRADSGLIISEAILIRPDGQGYPNTPGIYNDQQIQAWRKVTDKVHQKGGKIFAQLWHTGRVAHPSFFGGDYVLAPSALGLEGTMPRMRHLTYTIPKALTIDEINQLIVDFTQASANAIEAGFDGVEIHGANGYLIDQFLHYNSNHRQDDFGGSPENMARFALAIVDSVIERIGGDRTALRLSPVGYVNIEPDAQDCSVFNYLLAQLNSRPLAYLHEGMFDDNITFAFLGDDGKVSTYLRKHYKHTLIGVGGYTAEVGRQALLNNKFDLLAIGRPFIANPDYIEKVKKDEPLIEYSEEMLMQLN
jgi:2,4-dienoyl-CoA reductase-like NADH-dependent reductase (Old Yellow Enzyme family)